MKTINQIKQEFRDLNQDLIIIENGDLFIGSWDQLSDCFGISSDNLDIWCNSENYIYEIIKNVI